MSDPFNPEPRNEQRISKDQLTYAFTMAFRDGGFKGDIYTSDNAAFSRLQEQIADARRSADAQDIAAALRDAFIHTIGTGSISLAHFYQETAEKNGLSVQPIENDEKFLAELRTCALEHLKRYKVFEAAKVIQKYFPKAKEDPAFMNALKERTIGYLSLFRPEDQPDPKRLQDFEQVFDAFRLTSEEKDALLQSRKFSTQEAKEPTL